MSTEVTRGQVQAIPSFLSWAEAVNVVDFCEEESLDQSILNTLHLIYTVMWLDHATDHVTKIKFPEKKSTVANKSKSFFGIS